MKLLIHTTKISNNKSVFIDVSTNVGNYSIELIKAGITGKLILVDPLNKNISVANQKILNLNFNNYNLIQCVSNFTGKQIFYTNLDNNLSGTDSLYEMRSIGYSVKIKKTEV